MKILTAHRIATGGIYEYPNLNRLEYRSKKFVDLDSLMTFLNNTKIKYRHYEDLEIMLNVVITELEAHAKAVNYSETMYEGNKL